MESYKAASSDDRTVTNVPGKHLKGFSSDKVSYFHALQKSFNFFPRNLGKFFKNIQRITIFPSNISTLESADLQSFPQLIFLFLDNNKLREIPRDLFKFNPKLEFLSLFSNKIQYVEKGAFASLKNLTTFYFNDNSCHSGAATNRTAVLNLIKEIEGKCNKKPTIIEEKIHNPITTDDLLVIEQLFLENGKLKQQASDKQHKAELQNANKKCKSEATARDAKIVELLKQIEVLRKEGASKKPCGVLKLDEIAKNLEKKFKNFEDKIDSKLNLISEKISAIKSKKRAIK